MWSFFHGWQRKAGIVTLAMACVFMAAWMRSLNSAEVIHLHFGHSDLVSLSGCGRFAVIRGYLCDVVSEDIEGRRSVRFILRKAQATDRYSRISVPADEVSLSGDRTLVPYWSITIPITLLSAYLILGSPRKAKSSDQPATSNPISN